MKNILIIFISFISFSFSTPLNVNVYVDYWEIKALDKDNKERVYNLSYKVNGDQLTLKECQLTNFTQLNNQILRPVIKSVIRAKVKTLKSWETRLNSRQLLIEINEKLINNKTGCAPKIRTFSIEK